MRLKNKTTLLVLSLALGAFIACSDDDDSTPAAGSGGGGGGTTAAVNKYNGSASYGDILTFEIDQTNQSYTADNLTTGATVTNSYTELDAAVEIDSVVYDVFEDLYEIDESGGGKSYAIEIADRILAGNFPTGRAANDIFLAVTDERSLVGQEAQMVGTYFYVSLEPGQQANGENEWGQFTIEEDGDLYGFYTTTTAPEDTSYFLPVDSADEANISNTFYLDVYINNDGKSLRFYDENDSLTDFVGYVYLDGESTAMMIDLGTGNGTVFAFKTDMAQLGSSGEDFSSYVGEYKYVDFYENFDIEKGAGNFAINANKTFDISLIGFDTDPSVNDYFVDVTVGAGMTWTGVPGIYHSDNWDGQGSTLYHVFAGDFVMYFDYDSNDQFRGYGIGGEL